MTGKYAKRPIALLLALALAVSLLCVGVVPAAAAEATYTFNAAELTAAADKESLTGATFAEGYIATFGELTKRTSSNGDVKSVEVGKNGASGFTFTVGGTADVSVEFSSTGGSNSSTAGLWNEAGELVPSNEGVSVVSGTDKTALTYTALPAGTYQVVSPDATEHNRGARVYTITVKDSAGERAPRLAWDQVAPPTITDIKAQDGTITVSYAMAEGYDGADSVSVTMLGPDNASADGKEGVAVFTPKFSGQYTFAVIARRDGETDKTVHSAAPVDFILPLAAPVVANAASLGGGKINVDWDPVTEATGYNVYMDGAAKPVNTIPVKTTELGVSDLALGSVHTFTVTAVRNAEESAHSEPKEGTATPERQQAWRFSAFGVGARPEKNHVKGDLNRDGQVTLISEGGSGKILEASSDGLAFYYTAIPTDKNFTLRAKVHVNAWENRSYQNGFGVAALDRIGSGSAEVWNNSVLVGGMRYAYFYDKDTGEVFAEKDPTHTGEKYKMRLGVSALCRSGVTWEGLDAMGGEITFPPGFTSINKTLESFAVSEGKAPGTYNIIANGAAGECEDLAATTADFVLEVQRNNTGYFASYYTADGQLIGRHKTYDPKALDQLDSDYVYAGFFTSRLMDATFSDVSLKVNDPSKDPAPEAKPKSKLPTKFIVYSASVGNSADYDLISIANVAGQYRTTVNGVDGPAATTAANGRVDIPIKLVPGKNTITVTFTPDANQTFDDPDMVLASAEPVVQTLEVTYDDHLAGRRYLYVSPTGSKDGDGSFMRPLDLQTALDHAAPGQTVVLREGTYSLTTGVIIRKGINGTQDAPIYLIADPAAATRPVLDFQEIGSGMSILGDWWYLYGFDVTRATNEGINVAGSHNVLDQVNTYRNLATGLQISRASQADYQMEYWPSHNLILNCTSHHNIDPGYADADGFGAKLTCGVGNVFDGCVSYRNSDDGWDLYAKAESGSIGKVVIQNCVAYFNGYLDDGTPAGDGNGFKMGGESITAYHEAVNSLSFFNKNSGFSTNSCPDLQLRNVTAFDNDHLNVNFYTKLAKNTDFGASGVLSVKQTHALQHADQFAPTGSQDPAKVLNATNYFWNGVKSVNTDAVEVGADAFLSTTFQGVARNADGTLNMGDFLKKSDKAPQGAGAQLAGAPSLALKPIATTTQAGDKTTISWPDGERVERSASTVTVYDAKGQTVAQVALPTATLTPAQPFTDVPAGHWALEAVNALAGMELVQGVDATAHRYDLTSPVTRASLAQILFRLAQGQDGKSASFTDVTADAWYAHAVAWCAHYGVVTGYSGGAFGPNDPITREQLCLMLQRFAALLGRDAAGSADSLKTFSDAASVSLWAQNAMAWAVDAGIVTGNGAGALDPQGTASRAETAVMLWRFIQALG